MISLITDDDHLRWAQVLHPHNRVQPNAATHGLALEEVFRHLAKEQ
jgi:hypothetical protein